MRRGVGSSRNAFIHDRRTHLGQNYKIFLLPLFADPPNSPEISGYIEGETIRLGQTVTLVCTSAGGNPPAKIAWFRNGVQTDTSYTSSGRESRNTYSFVAGADDNDAVFRCEASNKLVPEPMSAEIVLAVQCKCVCQKWDMCTGEYGISPFTSRS